MYIYINIKMCSEEKLILTYIPLDDNGKPVPRILILYNSEN